MNGLGSPSWEVLRVVEARPGIHIREVARELGVHEATADYHLRRLWRANLVRRERCGRVVAHYASGCGLSRTERAFLRLTPAGRRVLSELAAAVGPLRAADLARATGERPGCVRYALDRALRLDLVRVVGFGKFEVAPDVRPGLRGREVP